MRNSLRRFLFLVFSFNSNALFIFFKDSRLLDLDLAGKLLDRLRCELDDGLGDGLGDVPEEADVLLGDAVQAVTGGVVTDSHPGPEVRGVRHRHAGERELTEDVLKLAVKAIPDDDKLPFEVPPCNTKIWQCHFSGEIFAAPEFFCPAVSQRSHQPDQMKIFLSYFVVTRSP